MRRSTTWPVLQTYDPDHLDRIAMPIGGIGTGTVSLGGRGDLRDWEVMNRPAKGYTPHADNLRLGPFFALWSQAKGQAADTRLLEGPLPASARDGSHGSPAANHGMPRFRSARFAAAYPFAQVLLDDPAVPLGVRLEAFNPLIPADVERSAMPVAVIRFVLANRGDQPVQAAICATLPNFIGQDGASPAIDANGNPDYRAGCLHNRNQFRQRDGLRGLYMDSQGVDPTCPQWGSLALTTTATKGITYRSAWSSEWGAANQEFWDDFSEDGQIDDDPDRPHSTPTASLAVRLTVPPGDERTITYILAWHFPNRPTWTPAPPAETMEETVEFNRAAAQADSSCCDTGTCDQPAQTAPHPDTIGNHYCTRFTDAWDAAAKTKADLRQLEADTIAFVQTITQSDLPPEIQEAALANLSTLRSQTCFQTADGTFAAWEGCSDHAGCCHGSCNHVWNYELATSFLYGDLARSMRRYQFIHGTDDHGLMSFRTGLPAERARDFRYAAADGTLGAIVRLYIDWTLSGDDTLLRDLWPQVRRALHFCWIEGGWDYDQDGVMEGCQHNTMDVEYFGPNPQIQTWYLAALRAAEEMATYLGDYPIIDLAIELFISGSRWTDGFLYNGAYYEQQIVSPVSLQHIAPGLQLKKYHEFDLRQPDFQLGEGCLIDQLVGQHIAQLCGLGHLLEPEHVSTTVASIYQRNRRTDFRDHFSPTRSYALPGDRGILMATFPDGCRPYKPFPYHAEVMSGFEYTLAVGLIQEGHEREALQIVRDIRARYDGASRNPFDEAECGHHYARALASWNLIPAYTQFLYSGVSGTMRVADRDGHYPWSTGDAWGTIRVRTTKTGRSIRLDILGGTLRLREIGITGLHTHPIKRPGTYTAGDTVHTRIRAN